MFINFECKDCGNSFRVSETDICDANQLCCPICKKKVSTKFRSQLHDFCVDKNSQGFEVTFSSSPRLSAASILNNAVNICAYELRDKGVEIKSLDDIASALKSDKEYIAITALLEGIIFAYHDELKSALAISGIDIGEMR